ncbi:MAG: hypothetical protein J6S69_06205, partial [Proteobacteria bacterium]|nr:hypothetical protein [Pseudomonadota bacterium]
LRPKPRQGAEPLGTCNEFDVFVNEPGTDNTRFFGKIGTRSPIFRPRDIPLRKSFVTLRTPWILHPADE